MVEPLLYAALGFLTASLLALFLGRALWHRAVRLTTQRVMRRLPLSRDEIVASRDLVRAEQAVEHRRLERQANIMRSRMAESMAAASRKDQELAELRAGLENDRQKLAQASKELARLAELEKTLAAVRKDLKAVEHERDEILQLADARRAEAATAQSQTASARQTIAMLEKQLAGLRSNSETVEERLARTNDAAKKENERAEAIHNKLLNTESQLAQALTKLELESREARGAVDTLRGEKRSLETQLAAARLESRAGAAAVPAQNPDQEMALLRQHIERLAADIARAVGDGKPAPARKAARPRAVQSAKSASQA